MRSAVRNFVRSQTVSWTCSNLTCGLPIHWISLIVTDAEGHQIPLRCTSKRVLRGKKKDSTDLVINSLCVLFKDTRFNFPAVYSYHKPYKTTPYAHDVILPSPVLACVSPFQAFLHQYYSISPSLTWMLHAARKTRHHALYYKISYTLPISIQILLSEPFSNTVNLQHTTSLRSLMNKKYNYCLVMPVRWFERPRILIYARGGLTCSCLLYQLPVLLSRATCISALFSNICYLKVKHDRKRYAVGSWPQRLFTTFINRLYKTLRRAGKYSPTDGHFLLAVTELTQR